MIDSLKNYLKDDEFQLILSKDGVYVKNYKRLISIDEKEISFTSKNNKIVVKGEKLFLRKILDSEFFIQGLIFHIEVHYGE